jgi:hypothetical protein
MQCVHVNESVKITAAIVIVTAAAEIAVAIN